jgi:hypothetical protein
MPYMKLNPWIVEIVPRQQPPAHAPTRPGIADHGRVMRCISFTALLGLTWKCRAVACVYPRLVCGVIRTDL